MIRNPKHWYRPDMDDNVGYLLGGPEYYREDKHFLDPVTAGSQRLNPISKAALQS